MLEWWHEVGFVKHDQCVRPDQPGMVRPHLPRHAVSLEEKPRADHVHCAHDDRRRGGVLEPLAVVDVLAAQRRDGQEAIAKAERAGNCLVFLHPVAQAFGNLGRLIHDRPAIDDVHESTGQ